jgi:hypothetical protein
MQLNGESHHRCSGVFDEQQATAKNIPHALAKWWPIRYNG